MILSPRPLSHPGQGPVRSACNPQRHHLPGGQSEPLLAGGSSTGQPFPTGIFACRQNHFSFAIPRNLEREVARAGFAGHLELNGAAHRVGREFELFEIGELRAMFEAPETGRERVLKHGGGVEIEGALFVALALVGLVINPHGRNAEVLDRQETC